MLTDILIKDFTKSFDKMPHQRLIHRNIRNLGSLAVNILVEHVLKDKKKRVACEGKYSDTGHMLSVKFRKVQ